MTYPVRHGDAYGEVSGGRGLNTRPAGNLALLPSPCAGGRPGQPVPTTGPTPSLLDRVRAWRERGARSRAAARYDQNRGRRGRRSGDGSPSPESHHCDKRLRRHRTARQGFWPRSRCRCCLRCGGNDRPGCVVGHCKLRYRELALRTEAEAREYTVCA